MNATVLFNALAALEVAMHNADAPLSAKEYVQVVNAWSELKHELDKAGLQVPVEQVPS